HATQPGISDYPRTFPRPPPYLQALNEIRKGLTPKIHLEATPIFQRQFFGFRPNLTPRLLGNQSLSRFITFLAKCSLYSPGNRISDIFNAVGFITPVTSFFKG